MDGLGDGFRLGTDMVIYTRLNILFSIPVSLKIICDTF